jgi:hypothetical protein
MVDYEGNCFDQPGHRLGESRFSMDGALVAAHGGVALHHHKRTLHAVQLIFLG